jgi:hypothetical protein
MIRKTVTYTDFNDNEQQEDLYFHLSKSQLLDMEMSHEGGLSTILPEMVKAGKVDEIWRLVKLMVGKAYGKRSEDGKRFVQASDKEVADLLTSPAFDSLFTDLTSSPEAMVEFITGLIPKDLLKDLQLPVASEAVPWANRRPTAEEIQGMTKEQLAEVMLRKPDSQE